MNYGDGDGTQFFNFAGSLDVVAHEIDHGFTQYHSNLTYSGQSGGMNESFSDIAGTTAKFYYDAKTADFNLGGDIFVQANTYIRYMCKPSTDGMSIDNASQYKTVARRALLLGRHEPRLLSRGQAPVGRRSATTGTATADGVKRASQAWYEANASHWTTSTQLTPGLPGRRRRGDGAEVFGGRHLGARRLVEGRRRHLQLHPRQRLRRCR